MARLPAALKAELQKERPEFSMWLDIGPLPDGTTWRISSHATKSAAAPGPGEPVVLRWGTVREAIDPFNADLIAAELNPVITDEGDPYGNGRRYFARLQAKWGKALRRTPVVLTWAGGGTTYTRFSGLLANYVQTGTMQWQLFCRTDDAALNEETGASVPKALQASYLTSTPDAFRQQYVSIIFGSHDSNGLGGEGLIPCYPEDATRKNYTVGIGTLTVPAVYVDGVVTSTANYTIQTTTVNGLLRTRIAFTTAQAEDAEITADVDGLTSTVGGGGTLQTNGSQLLKWLVWFVFNDFRGGAYPLDATAPVHVAAFTALDTFLGRNDHESSMFLGGNTQQKAAEVLRKWLESHEARAYWRHDGKLAVGALDPIPPSDIYALPYHFEASVDALSDLSTPRDETNIAREAVVEYAPRASQGDLGLKLRQMDVTVPEKVTVPLQLLNSGARVV